MGTNMGPTSRRLRVRGLHRVPSAESIPSDWAHEIGMKDAAMSSIPVDRHDFRRKWGQSDPGLKIAPLV